jgi:hypothetical protein
MQGAGHHPWEIGRSDSTSLGVAGVWCRGLGAAAEGVAAVHEHRTALVVHHGQVVHSVQGVDEGRRCVRARKPGFAKRPG